MAKGIRSKVKRANRTEQRRIKVDPMIAKRTKELAEKLEKDINMKSGSRLMALARSFNQGKKAGKVSAKAIKGKKALATKANKSTRRTRSSSQEDAMDEDGDDDDDEEEEEGAGGRRRRGQYWGDEERNYGSTTRTPCETSF